MRSAPMLLPVLCLAACGQSGALYLPDEPPAAATPVVAPAVPAPETQDEKEAGEGGTSPSPSATPSAPTP